MSEELTLNESQTNFEYMKQYYWDRDVFCETVLSAISIDRLLDAFCHGPMSQGSYFAWFNDEDEFYIVHKNSGMLVNWYKHLGRSNTCNQDGKTIDDLREFFILFKEDLEEWAEYHDIELDE